MSQRAASLRDWRRVFESALLEQDHDELPKRLRDAKNAVMDRIEDSFDTASLAERKLLLAALNTISELQRLSNAESLPSQTASALGDAA
jgi:hypothetical protein